MSAFRFNCGMNDAFISPSGTLATPMLCMWCLHTHTGVKEYYCSRANRCRFLRGLSIEFRVLDNWFFCSHFNESPTACVIITQMQIFYFNLIWLVSIWFVRFLLPFWMRSAKIEIVHGSLLYCVISFFSSLSFNLGSNLTVGVYWVMNKFIIHLVFQVAWHT